MQPLRRSDSGADMTDDLVESGRTADGRFACGNSIRDGAKRCAAQLRGRPGFFCARPAARGKARCLLHGGAVNSGAQPGNRNAWKHGRRSAAAVEVRKARTVVLRQTWNLLHALEQAAREIGLMPRR
jgi:hypothetical protein